MTVSDFEFEVDNVNRPWPFPTEDGRHPFWMEVRAKSLILPADSMAEISKYIIDNCKRNKECQKKSREIQQKMNEINSLMGKK